MSFGLKIINGLVYDGNGGKPVATNVAVSRGVTSEIGACERRAELVTVIVAGELEVEDDQVTAAGPGQLLRMGQARSN